MLTMLLNITQCHCLSHHIVFSLLGEVQTVMNHRNRCMRNQEGLVSCVFPKKYPGNLLRRLYFKIAQFNVSENPRKDVSQHSMFLSLSYGMGMKFSYIFFRENRMIVGYFRNVIAMLEFIENFRNETIASSAAHIVQFQEKLKMSKIVKGIGGLALGTARETTVITQKLVFTVARNVAVHHVEHKVSEEAKEALKVIADTLGKIVQSVIHVRPGLVLFLSSSQ